MNFKKYIKIGIGSVPIILCCPHGGYKKPKTIPDKLKEKSKIKGDKNTLILAKRLIYELKGRKIEIYYILSKIHRKKIDFNRPPRADFAFDHVSIEAQQIHAYFHEQIQILYRMCRFKFHKCLFIDFHGFSKPNPEYPDIIFGNLFGKTLNVIEKRSDLSRRDSLNYWGFSELIEEFSKGFTIDNGLGTTNFNNAYSGGYITHQFYKKQNCNAMQIEVSKHIRVDFDLADKFINAFVTALLNCLQED